MSDKTMYRFGDTINLSRGADIEAIESRGYKKAVKSFQVKYPKLKMFMLHGIKRELS